MRLPWAPTAAALVAFATAGVLAQDPVTSDGPTSAEDGFDSGMMDPDGRWEFTFPTVGSYDYFCRPHPYMRATVRVEGTGNDTEPSVAIRNYRFEPATVSVPPGTRVQWTNEDDVGHTVTELSHAADPGGGYVFVWIAAAVVAVLLLFVAVRLFR